MQTADYFMPLYLSACVCMCVCVCLCVCGHQVQYNLGQPHEDCPGAFSHHSYKDLPLSYLFMGTSKPHSNGLLYSNTVIGTLAVDGWVVTFGIARRGLYQLHII